MHYNISIIDRLHAEMREAYRLQKKNAFARGIPFLFSLDEWVSFWFQPDPIVGDGVPAWFRRGNGREQYVMARFGDEGPYEIGNVAIATNLTNIRTRKPSPNRFSSTAKRRVLIKTTRTPRPIRTPKGDFASLGAAARAYDRDKKVVRRWCLRAGTGFRYLEAWEALDGMERPVGTERTASGSVTAQTLQGGL